MSLTRSYARRAALALTIGCSSIVPSFAQTGAATPAAPKPATPAATAAAPAAKAVALEAPGKGTADRFGGVAANLPGIDGETVIIDLIRWSTDAERDKLVATLKDKGDKEFASALGQAPSLGYMWRSGSGFGAFVRYATKFKAADGEHVVIVTDSDLATWVNKPGATAAPAKYPYAVVELSVAAAAPAGKTSLAGKVIADGDVKSVRLEDFKTAPVALKGVKHIKGGA